MKCREVLLEMREQRERRLLCPPKIQYSTLLHPPNECPLHSIISRKKHWVFSVGNTRCRSCGHIPQGFQLKERWCLLTLELPYEVADPTTFLDSYTKNSDFDLEAKELPITIKRAKNPVAQNFIENVQGSSLIEKWYRQAGNALDNKHSFLESVRKHGWWPQYLDAAGISTEVPFEDLINYLPGIRDQILSSNSLKPKSKKTYLSRLNALKKFLQKNRPLGRKWDIRGKCSTFFIEALPLYFDYLERRALSSYKIEYYRDLLEVRLLFYVPLEIQVLANLTFGNIDLNKEVLRLKNTEFPLPQAFIELAKSLLTETDTLMRRNSKKFYGFIEQTSKSAHLREKLNPTLIKSAFSAICRKMGILPNNLPYRLTKNCIDLSTSFLL